MFSGMVTMRVSLRFLDSITNNFSFLLVAPEVTGDEVPVKPWRSSQVSVPSSMWPILKFIARCHLVATEEASLEMPMFGHWDGLSGYTFQETQFNCTLQTRPTLTSRHYAYTLFFLIYMFVYLMLGWATSLSIVLCLLFHLEIKGCMGHSQLVTQRTD